MSIDRHRRDYAIASPRRRLGLEAPRFYLRLRLRLVLQAIAQVEAQLADDFATLETAPLIRELEMLVLERDSLLKRLADAG